MAPAIQAVPLCVFQFATLQQVPLMLRLKLQLEVRVTMLERVGLTILLLFHLTAITPTPPGAAGPS